MKSEKTSSDKDARVTSTTSKKNRRMWDVAAELNLLSHKTGPGFRCKKNCFKEVSYIITQIINRTNEIKSNDKLNNYLAGLMKVLPVVRRRPRNKEREVIYRDLNVLPCSVSE